MGLKGRKESALSGSNGGLNEEWVFRQKKMAVLYVFMGGKAMGLLENRVVI